MKPEDAPARARELAAARRSQGGYAGVGEGGALDETFDFETPTVERLSELAVIDVDHQSLYSTRRGGAPVTALKRLLLRLMRQYFVEVEARHTRFNLAVVSTLQDLDRRVRRLEDERSSGE